MRQTRTGAVIPATAQVRARTTGLAPSRAADRAKLAVRAEQEKMKLEAVVKDLRTDFKDTSEDTMAIASDMTRQYKAMEEHFLGDISALEKQVHELKDELQESRTHYEELQAEKDAIVAAKDEEIRALQAKMSDMAAEFAEMLQETLAKMADKIEISSSSWEAADASVPVLTGGGTTAGASASASTAAALAAPSAGADA